MKKQLKKICSLLLAALTVFCVSGCRDKGEDSSISSEVEEVLESTGYKLVNGGLSEYVILLADDAQANETLAAQELQTVLHDSTGAWLSIAYENGDNGQNSFNQHWEHRPCRRRGDFGR